MDDFQKLLNIFHKTTLQKLLNADSTLDVSKATSFYFRLEKCLMSGGYYNYSEMSPILLVLDTANEGTGNDMLSPDNMAQFLKSGLSKKCNVIFLHYDGRKIDRDDRKDLLIENPADACQFSSDSSMNVFFVVNNELNIFSHGKYLDCIPNVHSHNKTKKISDASLPASEYRKLLNAHYKVRVCKDIIMNCWQNKAKRLLVASPERIFGKDLAYFLDQNIADACVDVECYSAWTNDRTDIRLLRYEDRKIYIIEVKWLGKSISYGCSITEYKDDRADVGIVQLNDYLGAEPKAICGVLVIYDARKDNIDIKWSEKIPRDARIETPMRFYLISESASERAKRVVKEYKSKQKTEDN
jgi:hypothetical protein